MILKMADKLTNYICDKENIQSEKEIYRQGIALYISETLSFGSILLLSFCTGHIFYAIIYVLLFSKMRETFGGFHCQSFKTCIITYIGIYGLFEILMHIMVPECFQIFCMTLAVVIIWKLAPVEHVSKKLNSETKEEFQKKAKQLITALTICFYVSNFEYGNIAYTIWYCVCANAILMVLGKMRWYY